MPDLSASEIPNGEILFRYCKPSAFPLDQEEIPSGIFNDPELSCDWQRYRINPLSSFHIAEGRTVIIAISICDEIRCPRNPKRRGQIVEAWRQKILHDPISIEQDQLHGANDAHSLIKGMKKLPVLEAIRAHSTKYKY